MSITLIKSAQDVRELLTVVDPETGELCESYTQTRALFETKGVGCIAYVKELSAEIQSAKAMLKEMQEQVQKQEAHMERFLDYIGGCMKVAGITEVRHEAGLFGARLYLGRDESVELQDGTEFPPELCNAPKPPTPSKTKIKAAIKAGLLVAGAQIVRKDRLALF